MFIFVVTDLVFRVPAPSMFIFVVTDLVFRVPLGIVPTEDLISLLEEV
jgi:hypothetical protein